MPRLDWQMNDSLMHQDLKRFVQALPSVTLALAQDSGWQYKWCTPCWPAASLLQFGTQMHTDCAQLHVCHSGADRGVAARTTSPLCAGAVECDAGAGARLGVVHSLLARSQPPALWHANAH